MREKEKKEEDPRKNRLSVPVYRDRYLILRGYVPAYVSIAVRADLHRGLFLPREFVLENLSRPYISHGSSLACQLTRTPLLSSHNLLNLSSLSCSTKSSLSLPLSLSLVSFNGARRAIVFRFETCERHESAYSTDRKIVGLLCVQGGVA